MVSQAREAHVASSDDIRLALARAVATRQVPKAALSAVAKQLAATKLPLRDIDICTHGICLEYLFDDERWSQAIKEIVTVKGAGIHAVTVFPWGIPFPDVYRVRVELAFDQLSQSAGPG